MSEGEMKQGSFQGQPQQAANSRRPLPHTLLLVVLVEQVVPVCSQLWWPWTHSAANRAGLTLPLRALEGERCLQVLFRQCISSQATLFPLDGTVSPSWRCFWDYELEHLPTDSPSVSSSTLFCTKIFQNMVVIFSPRIIKITIQVHFY